LKQWQEIIAVFGRRRKYAKLNLHALYLLFILLKGQ